MEKNSPIVVNNMPLKRFMISDVMNLPDDYSEGCDMTYTDPPWENRMVKWFETDMRKKGFEPPKNDIDKIIERLFFLAPKNLPTFVEYGKKGFERVINIGESCGFNFVQKIFGYQTTKQPFVVLQFNSNLPMPKSAIHGFDVLNMAIEHHNPKCIFEPFAGLGITSKIMDKHGVNIVAAELNPIRAARLKEKFND